MGYAHILNLYKPEAQDILMFKECYAMEKIHGTSAHIGYKQGQPRLNFFSGGESHTNFVQLFDEPALFAAFAAFGYEAIIVYGEAYGGKQQRQSWRYGHSLKFVAFDVKVGDVFLSVPDAEDVCKKLGLEFVHYTRIPTTMEAIDAERDAVSEQAKRNGVEEKDGVFLRREGVVLRPLFEAVKNNGERIVAKHKRDEERETKSVRVVGDEKKAGELASAQAFCDEYVTRNRLDHVLDHVKAALGRDPSIEDMRAILDAMVEDCVREGAERLPHDPDNKELLPITGALRGAIGGKTAKMYKVLLQEKLRENAA